MRTSDGPFIVQELVEGTTLAIHLAETGPVAPESVVDIISQVAAALDHAHGLGVIHRDIKPANLIFEPGGRVRLADFGIARTVDDAATITASGEMVGTITYLAPEILAGEPATVASDVYSLGAVTYELLAGRPPYQAETPAAMLEAVRSAEVPDLHGIAPDGMAAAVSAAMSKDPAARPETAGAFAANLIGSATLVMSTAPIAPSAHRGSEEPTVVTDRPPPSVRHGTARAQASIRLASPPPTAGSGRSRGRRDVERSDRRWWGPRDRRHNHASPGHDDTFHRPNNDHPARRPRPSRRRPRPRPW